MKACRGTGERRRCREVSRTAAALVRSEGTLGCAKLVQIILGAEKKLPQHAFKLQILYTALPAKSNRYQTRIRLLPRVT